MMFWYYWYSTGTKRVHCNIVYQEYVAERDHTHMNATQWETLTEFVKWLGREGHCVVDETPKGWFVTYIDKDPEVIARQKVWFYQTFETNLFFNLINFKLFYTSIQGKFIWNCKINASFREIERNERNENLRETRFKIVLKFSFLSIFHILAIKA